MLISWAILSRTMAVGVGFLLNSISNVINWSCVALWRFWFFCCCVKVLLRGGRRGAEPCVVEVVADGAGEGVDDISATSSVLIDRLVEVLERQHFGVSLALVPLGGATTRTMGVKGRTSQVARTQSSRVRDGVL